MTERGRRWRKQLLDDVKERGGYWKLKGDTLDHSLQILLFGRGYGSVLRLTRE
jgi:hypothetical protein